MYNFESREALVQFIASEVVNTSEAITILDCSRQYLDKLVKQGKLEPIKKLEKDKWFLKSDILKRKESQK